MALSKPTKELRVVLVGKTGSGKSALGNSLLGMKEHFNSFPSSKSTTVKCGLGGKILPDGTRLVVIDTPGVFDTSTSEEQTREEIGKCIGLSSPGPHVFMFVLKVGRFTDEELQTVDRLIDLFGEEVKKFLFAVFTGKDDLDDAKKTLDDYLVEGSERLRQVLMSKCQNRYAAINNRASEEDRQKDVDYILDLTRKTVSSNNGNHYTGAMFTRAEEYLREKIEAKKRAGLSEAGARSEVRQELSYGQYAVEILKCIMPAIQTGVEAFIAHKYTQK